MNTTVISIANLKGGVGKTTTALSLGAGLALKGKNVLLVDIDDNNQSLTGTLGVKQDPKRSTLSNLILKASLDEDISGNIDRSIIRCGEGFDLLPGDHRLVGISNYLSYQTLAGEASGDGTLLYLRRIIDSIRDRYDFIIIDTGANYNPLFLNALSASDEVIIPSQAQKMSDSGTIETLDSIAKVKDCANPCLINRGILITMVDNRTRYSKEKARRIDLEFTEMGLTVFKTVIPRTIRAEEYAESGKSILSYAKKSKAALGYMDLVTEYLREEEIK